jgi:hypothetical protein
MAEFVAKFAHRSYKAKSAMSLLTAYDHLLIDLQSCGPCATSKVLADVRKLLRKR